MLFVLNPASVVRTLIYELKIQAEEPIKSLENCTTLGIDGEFRILTNDSLTSSVETTILS